MRGGGEMAGREVSEFGMERRRATNQARKEIRDGLVYVQKRKVGAFR